MSRIKRTTDKKEDAAQFGAPSTPGSSTAKDAAGGQLPELTASHIIIKKPLGVTTRVAQPYSGPKPERVEPPKVTKYRVLKGGNIAGNGFPQKLSDNKVIDDVNYNVESLIEQGIVLERIQAP